MHVVVSVCAHACIIFMNGIVPLTAGFFVKKKKMAKLQMGSRIDVAILLTDLSAMASSVRKALFGFPILGLLLTRSTQKR